jgi:hypothetical protein
VDYLKKREGWNRALKKYLAANQHTNSLRVLDLPFETRLQMAVNQERHAVATLIGREFDLLTVWEESGRDCVCMCTCGRPVEIPAHRLVTGNAKDCGHRANEAKRIRRYRRAQKAKLSAKEARADRKRVLLILKDRKRKPPRKFWTGLGGGVGNEFTQETESAFVQKSELCLRI